MPALSYYSNVHNTALAILQQKGYRVWAERDHAIYYAEKSGWDFMANDPVQLLGIVAIYETQAPSKFREYWWKINEPWLVNDLPNTPPDYVPVWKNKPPAMDDCN